MIINTKKLKNLVEKAMKGQGVFVGKIANSEGKIGYCINTSNIRMFVNDDYADNEFKAILTAVMGKVPMLNEKGQYYYCADTKQIQKQEILYQHFEFSNNVEPAILTDITIDENVVVIYANSLRLNGFNENYMTIINDNKATREEEIPQILARDNYLIYKSNYFEVVIVAGYSSYCKYVITSLQKSEFAKDTVKMSKTREEE